MSPEQRIQHITSFVLDQHFVRDLKFTVTENNDEFTITFNKASERQLSTLRHRLRIHELNHIQVKALEITKYENKPKPWKNKKKS